MRKRYSRHQKRQAFVQGGSFGLTSAIITTLGLMVGLYSGTHSRLAVIGGIVVAVNYFVGVLVSRPGL